MSASEPKCKHDADVEIGTRRAVTPHDGKAETFEAVSTPDPVGEETAAAESPPPSDPVAVALATALERASAAGEWEAVKVLATQLDAHRKARQDRKVVDFEAAKERRKR